MPLETSLPPKSITEYRAPTKSIALLTRNPSLLGFG
jgi:hypothetical protein